jgi:hypothetical protein
MAVNVIATGNRFLEDGCMLLAPVGHLASPSTHRDGAVTAACPPKAFDMRQLQGDGSDICGAQFATNQGDHGSDEPAI